MYTTGEVAVGFDVTRETVNEWVRRGRLSTVAVANLRGDRRFDPKVIAAFAQEHGMIFVPPAQTEPNN